MAVSTQIRFSDDMIGDPNDLDNLIEATGQNVSDVSGDEEQEQRGSGEEEERQESDNEGEQSKKKDDKSDDAPKKKRKLGPRLNLNPERLKGPRGLTALLKEFENFKFKGKGHEKEDLERVLAKMEHWAHRLHPKLHFEDFITKAEKICTKKKEMQVYMNRLRMGLETADEEIIREEDEEEEAPRTVQNEALNEFDKLLDEQISYYDNNRRDHVQTPKTPSTLPSSPAFVPITASTLTSEQKEMIARKKKEAMERRLARLKELEEEHLAEATAASLATATEEKGADFNEPAQVPSIQVPSNNTDMSAEQRERAARNKQLALERLRARRLAAQGIQQTSPDLNVSSMSDLAVPLSPNGCLTSPKTTPRTSSKTTSRSSPVESPKRSSLSVEPAGSADQCDETSSPDKTNETEDEAAAISHCSERMDETEDLVSFGTGQSRLNLPSSSKKLSDTVDDVSPNDGEDSAFVSERMNNTNRGHSLQDLPSISEKFAETEGNVSPDVHHEESTPASDGKNATHDSVSSGKSKFHPKDVLSSPEKMETDDIVVPSKEILSGASDEPAVSEKMDETGDSTVSSLNHAVP